MVTERNGGVLENARRIAEEESEPFERELPRFVKHHRMLLVGEPHIAAADFARDALARTLKEMKRNGLTHVFVEAPSRLEKAFKGVDVRRKDAIREVSKVFQVPGYAAGFQEGNFRLMIEARKLGLSVVFADADYLNPEVKRRIEQDPGYRDRVMDETIGRSLGSRGRGLYLGGQNHMSKRPHTTAGAEVETAGMLLARRLGEKEVLSVRIAWKEDGFSSPYDALTPQEISPDGDTPTLLPEYGPFEYKVRGAFDYVVCEL